MDLTGVTKVLVPGTRKKCHRPRHEKILNGYDDFDTYTVVLSLQDTTNFDCLDVRGHVMTLKAIRVVGRLSQ